MFVSEEFSDVKFARAQLRYIAPGNDKNDRTDSVGRY